MFVLTETEYLAVPESERHKYTYHPGDYILPPPCSATPAVMVSPEEV